MQRQAVIGLIGGLSWESSARVGLLGTAFTMEQEFYKQRLKDKFGLDVVVPHADDRRIVHDIIYNELVMGEVLERSRATYREVIARLVAQGAQAIILGCTEIMLPIADGDSAVPLFDTTTIHAVAAVERALAAGQGGAPTVGAPLHDGLSQTMA
jgi:aspartate racemase